MVYRNDMLFLSDGSTVMARSGKLGPQWRDDDDVIAEKINRIDIIARWSAQGVCLCKFSLGENSLRRSLIYRYQCLGAGASVHTFKLLTIMLRYVECDGQVGHRFTGHFSGLLVSAFARNRLF